MEEREKIDLSNHEDYVLRTNNEAFVIIDLNEKLNKFIDNNRNSFYNHVCNVLHINVNDIYKKEIDTFYQEWCQDAIECTVLKPGGEWQKGKVRFRMKAEFFPDKTEEKKLEENGHQEVENITESPLDEIRQQLTQENES